MQLVTSAEMLRLVGPRSVGIAARVAWGGTALAAGVCGGRLARLGPRGGADARAQRDHSVFAAAQSSARCAGGVQEARGGARAFLPARV